jgi:hypothetical protein
VCLCRECTNAASLALPVEMAFSYFCLDIHFIVEHSSLFQVFLRHTLHGKASHQPPSVTIPIHCAIGTPCMPAGITRNNMEPTSLLAIILIIPSSSLPLSLFASLPLPQYRSKELHDLHHATIERDPHIFHIPEDIWLVTAARTSSKIIQEHIQRYLGPDASCERGKVDDHFCVTAYRNFTTETIRDLNANSRRWRAEG